MAFTNLLASATTFQDGVVSLGIESAVNAQLAAVLNRNIVGVQIVAKDKARKQGKELDVEVTHDSVGNVVLVQPFQLRTFIGTIATEAETLAAAFRAANPAFFFAAPFLRYFNEFASANRPFAVFQFYCADPNGEFNWLVNNPGAVGFLDSVVSVAISSTLAITDTYVRQTANAITTALPAAPLDGEVHHITHAGGGANNTLDGNGKNITTSSGTAATLTLVDGDTIQVKYDLTNDEWLEFT